jgi:hypothetical protein
VTVRLSLEWFGRAVVVDLVATNDPVDAPILAATYPDGSISLSRGDAPSPGWNKLLHVPHGIVVVDDQMSPFDESRRSSSTTAGSAQP